MKPACPKCGKPLCRVFNDSGWMNNDQFNSVKAGDWYCDSCVSDKARSGHAYFWDNEVMPRKEGE